MLNVTRRINGQNPEWIKERLDEQEMAPTRSELNKKKASQQTKQMMVDRLYGSVAREQVRRRGEQLENNNKSVSRARERCWGAGDAPPVGASPQQRNASHSCKSAVSERGAALHSRGILSRDPRWRDGEQRKHEELFYPMKPCLSSVRRERGTLDSTTTMLCRTGGRSRSGTYDSHEETYTRHPPAAHADAEDPSLDASKVGFEPAPKQRRRSSSEAVQNEIIATTPQVVEEKEEEEEEKKEEEEEEEEEIVPAPSPKSSFTRRSNGASSPFSKTAQHVADVVTAVQKKEEKKEEKEEKEDVVHHDRSGVDFPDDLPVQGGGGGGGGGGVESDLPENSPEQTENADEAAPDESCQDDEDDDKEVAEKQEAPEEEEEEDLDSDEEMERLLARAKAAAYCD